MDVNVTPFEIETKTRHGDMVRADVYLPRNSAGPFPVLLGASPYQKSLRYLPPVPATFPFIEYGPMQLYLDEGYAYVAMDTPGMGRSEGVWDPVSRTEGEAIHDMIEHVAGLDWSTGKIGMIGMSHYCWSQWNAARTKPAHLTCLGADARTTGLEPHQAGPADRPAQHGLQRGLAVHNPRRNHDTAYFLQRKGRYPATVGRKNPGCCRLHL